MRNGRSAHFIVLGNEKGGSGKSTAAIHLIVGLLRSGYTVASVDLDGRQRTLTRFLECREATCRARGTELPSPTHRVIMSSVAPRADRARADERERLSAVLAELAPAFDVVVIDTLGSDNFLSRLAHALADTLVTPVNDSLVDLDLLASVDPETGEVAGPGPYAEMVWEQRKRRLMRGGGALDWIVMRNRLSSLDARNKRRVGGLLGNAGRRYGFRVIAGFGERVIYRELFLSGLTVLDTHETGVGVGLAMSHVAARQELRSLIAALRLPSLQQQAIAV